MKKAKFCSAIIALLALGVVACNGNNSSSAPASSAAPSSQKSSSSSLAPSSSSVAPSSSSEASASTSSAPADTTDYTVVLERNWTEGAAVKNSSDKDVIPLTDAAAGKVGVKIAMVDFTLDAEGTTATGMDDSGKINPGNDHGAYIRYRVTAPKAGAYQMIMRGKSSTSNNALEKTLNNRAFDVKLNGVSVDVQGDRTPLTADQSDFVAVPTIMLTGQEDTIDVTASDYRIQFDRTGFVVFAEH